MAERGRVGIYQNTRCCVLLLAPGLTRAPAKSFSGLADGSPVGLEHSGEQLEVSAKAPAPRLVGVAG